jgi:hypothetical protein
LITLALLLHANITTLTKALAGLRQFNASLLESSQRWPPFTAGGEFHPALRMLPDYSDGEGNRWELAGMEGAMNLPCFNIAAFNAGALSVCHDFKCLRV